VMCADSSPTDGGLPESLVVACFAGAPEVRYVSVSCDARRIARERSGLTAASSAESDHYEEVLVNPTLLGLLRARGDIDCGGLQYVVIRYGAFFQVVHPIAGGHVSVALEPDVALDVAVPKVLHAIARWERADCR